MSLVIRQLREKLDIDLFPELKSMPDSYLSYIQHSTSDQAERLEYLGDSVLDLIVSNMLFDSLYDMGPNLLTQLRSLVTKNITLAYMLIKKNVCISRDKRCADKLEVLIGLIYQYTGKNIAFVERYLNEVFSLSKIVDNIIEFDAEIDGIVDQMMPVYSKWEKGTCNGGKAIDERKCISGSCNNLERERSCHNWSECSNGYQERYLLNGTKEVKLCNVTYGKCDKNGMRTVTSALGEHHNETCPEDLYEEEYITDDSCTNGKIIVYKKCKDPNKCTDIVWDSYPCEN